MIFTIKQLYNNKSIYNEQKQFLFIHQKHI
ncbi:hypothetical protein CoNPh35_CDS0046 [Staphylococcus phage S-CoN_Ph35]|nr:hypothetical protein CoNPh35_CDS0046 [Staphylococcus phage S-CoN_Ph35]